MDEASSTPEGTLRVVRIIWGAMLIGIIVTGAVILGVMGPSGNEGDAEPDPNAGMFALIAAAITVPAIGMGLFVRSQTFKKGWVGDAVTPGAYSSGNIVAWAACEGPCIIGIVFAFITDSVLPLIPAAFAFATLVLLFPNGKAMQPRAHEYR